MTKKLFIFCFSMSLLFFNFGISSIAQGYYPRCNDETENTLPPLPDPTPDSNILVEIKELTPGLLIVEGEGELTLVNPETNDSITIENEERDDISWSYQVTTENIQISIVIEEKTFTTNLDFIAKSGMQIQCSSKEDESIVREEKILFSEKKRTLTYISEALVVYKGISYRTENGTQKTIPVLKILKRVKTRNPTNNNGNRNDFSILSILLFPKDLGDFQEEFPLEDIRKLGLIRR